MEFFFIDLRSKLHLPLHGYFNNDDESQSVTRNFPNRQRFGIKLINEISCRYHANSTI